MLTAAEFEQHSRELEERRAARRGKKAEVWPGQIDPGGGLGEVAIEVGAGRGDLSYTSSFWPGIPLALAMIGKTISFNRLYESQPFIAACVDRMLRSAVRVPLKAYRRTGGENDRERLYSGDHVVATAIEEPWDRGSQADLKMALLGPMLVHGNSVIQVDHPRADVLNFIPKDWRYCRPIMPWRDSLVGFQFDIDIPQLKQDVSIDLVLHNKWWTPSGPIGTSPLQQLATTLTIEDAAQRWQRAAFATGQRPATAVSMAEGFLKMDKDKRKAIENQLRADLIALYSTPENAGKPFLLPPGLDVKAIGQTVVEAALIDQRKLDREECCAVYQIPPPLVSILDQATFRNIEILRDMLYCLPGDSLVSTDRGPVEAASIQAGDRVWSFDPGGMKLSVVSGCAQTSVDPLVKIRTGNRTLRCTDNHPVLVARRHKGDSRRRRSVRWTHEWVAAGQVKRGDLIVTADGFAREGVRSCPTRDDVSVGFMEFCGLLLGDGNVTYRDGVPSAVYIARSPDARYMDHYRQVMRQELVCAGRGRGAAAVAVTLNEQAMGTQFSSRRAAEELVELGLAGTAHTKRVPGWVFALAPDLRAAFVRGFCDADGSVDKKGHLTVYSANIGLLQQVRELCIGLGVPVANLNASRSWVKLPGGKRIFSVMWRFQSTDTQTTAAIIGSNDPQDQKRMEDGQSRGTKNYRYEGEGNAPPAVPGCGLARVLEVEKGDLAVPVYNISVPGTRNFVADGVVTHNTDCLGPPLVLCEQTFNAQVIRDLLGMDDVFVEFDFGGVLRGNRLLEIQALREGISTALMSPNEARTELNMPKVDLPGMDEFFLPFNNLQPVGHPAIPGIGAPAPPPQENPAGKRLHVRSRDRDYDLSLA